MFNQWLVNLYVETCIYLNMKVKDPGIYDSTRTFYILILIYSNLNVMCWLNV